MLDHYTTAPRSCRIGRFFPVYPLRKDNTRQAQFCQVPVFTGIVSLAKGREREEEEKEKRKLKRLQVVKESIHKIYPTRSQQHHE